MKQVAIIGTAVAALAGPLAQGAWAMPADVTPLVQSQPLPAVALELGSTQRLATQPAFGPTKAEQRADTLRGEALNRKYRLGTYKIGPSLAEQRADTLRGEALNRKYGLGVESLTLERGANDRFAADNPTRGDLVRLTPSTGSPSTFQWSAAGIGAGVLLGVVALIGAGFFEVRQHGRLGTS
ncbi:MAG TPA: hypothetical protein VLD16_10875 [Gaiellaceae bacterium]|nr:hypothetical protein [Gaiellaceae bacterium]